MLVVLISLSTFSITWLLVFEDGPRDYLDRFRNWIRSKYAVGKVVDCPVCLSCWVSIPVVIVGLLCPWALLPTAAIAVCILLFGIVGG